MKVKVIEDKCIGCGNCVALSESQLFDFNDAGLAECIVPTIPADLEETAKEAIEQCPTGAIEEVSEQVQESATEGTKETAETVSEQKTEKNTKEVSEE